MGAMLVPGLLYFNPPSREGSDKDTQEFTELNRKFQSTLP